MSLMTFGDKSLDLSLPHVMGILNVTPDSFSDGGAFNQLDNALQQAEKMIFDGASIIDVGGESTRPGAANVSVAEELDRVIPVIEAIKQRFDVVVSVDTSAAEVIVEAAAAGVGLINDVRALTSEGALPAAQKTALPVCLMHMQGSPVTMQNHPVYDSVLDEVLFFLRQRVSDCVAAGMDKASVILDPGIGFGKTLEHNLSLIKHLNLIEAEGFPVLIGASRKTMVGDVLGVAVGDRLYGTLGTHAAAFLNGATFFRAHDVKPHVDMLTMMYRIGRAK